MTDPIADMLTRIRNAFMAHKKEVVIPYSKTKKSILDILGKEGYIGEISKIEGKHADLQVVLKYKNKDSAITSLKRISKPGHRRYIKAKDIERVLNGYGMAIISTPKGVMTTRDARKLHILTLRPVVVCEHL